MRFLSKYFSKLPDIRDLPLKVYSFDFSLDKLTPGVDNIRYDVHLSPGFIKSVGDTIFSMVVSQAKVGRLLGMGKKQTWQSEKDEFKKLCGDIMLAGINRAKSDREIQIDFLAQAAIVKFITEEIGCRFTHLVEKLAHITRKNELSQHQNLDFTIRAKDEYARIQRERRSIILNVAREIFKWFMDVQNNQAKQMREANFGPAAILPKEFFENPILHAEHPLDDFFMLEEYVLMGHRLDDPNRYEEILTLIGKLLKTVMKLEQIPGRQSKDAARKTDQKSGFSEQNPTDTQIDRRIKHLGNIDILFNFFESGEKLKSLKKKDASKEKIKKITGRYHQQRALLTYVYNNFTKTGLIKRIAAAYEILPIYLEYCPPLAPQQVLQFLTIRRTRKTIIRQLRRLEGFYNKTFSIIPLRNKTKILRAMKDDKKKEYLIRFLKDFARYHRDLYNFKLIRRAMDQINLTREEKIINLSRANHTLHEFLLPHEYVLEEKPIIGHVILKADVRGSTDITYQMRKRGLNPASYFSLNLFDPINFILSEYGAGKVFIEGDAIILSIFEHQDTPGGWYSVGQACGLAIKMLLIVKRYNVLNIKHHLPALELGLGISYQNHPPTFLFDNEKRIMISPAINLADRLAGCSKQMRNMAALNKRPFNLYVFQTAREETMSATRDDLFLRYNVNGIELSTQAFEKLSKEIDLEARTVLIPGLQDAKIKVHTGKFPTITGKYHTLIIREARIPEIAADTLKAIRLTDRKYYEVCTNPKLYEYLKKNA
ncbi:MAG: hypothetical protein B6I22_07685 [Desulfobacteraceae bacterium 4572_123]|nr:MAG: hypothetical protein B6I22_07685 [Desulfobacteraceae bacterium 4572_123]